MCDTLLEQNLVEGKLGVDKWEEGRSGLEEVKGIHKQEAGCHENQQEEEEVLGMDNPSCSFAGEEAQTPWLGVQTCHLFCPSQSCAGFACMHKH